MNFQEIRAEIERGVFKPIYFLMGEEAYFIDALTSLLEKKVLSAEEKSFNQSILYGRETDINTVIAEAKRYPMMAERVLVMVKEAQNLRNLDQLEAYAANPQPTTVLVLAYKYKKLDKRTKLYKLLDNQKAVFLSKKLYDNQVPTWIEKYLHSQGYKTNPKALHLLAESLGTDLSRIVNELNKLAIVVPKGESITEAVVEDNIGISKDYNNFELQNAIGSANFVKAITILNVFAANPKDNPIVLTVGILYRFFSMLMLAHQSNDSSPRALAALLKVNPFFVDDYIEAMRNYNIKKCARVIGYLRECDKRSKGVDNASTSHPDLLKELVYKIFYA
jgi:DNA polymerase-3 subunit delta